MRRSSGRGPHFPFCRHVASSHIRCLCSFCCVKWFPNFGSKPFSGCLTESHRDPAGSRGGPSYPRGDTRFDFEGCNRSNRRCSESLFVSNFRYPQEIRGSSSNFESQGVQSVHFHSALPDGDPECDPSTAVSERLGCFNRFEGCVPSYSDSPVVQEISGFSVLGQDLPIEGPALRSQGFSLGVHKGGGHSCRSSSPVRSSSVLLCGRLASGGGVQGSFGVSSPYDPAVDSGPWVPRELGKVFPHSTETSVLSWGSSRHPKVVGSAFRAQSFGSSGGDSGSYQGSFGIRPLVAEISRPPCQLRGPCPQLQAADEASSASSSEVFHSLDRLSGQACSLESRNQGVVRGVGLSFSPSRREAVCCSSPVVGHHHGRVRSGVGGGSSPSPCVRGLVEGGGLGSYQYSGIEGSSSSSTEPRISCGGSFTSDSFRQRDGGIVHHSSGRNSFLIPVSAGLGPVGMVSSEKNFSSRGSHSRRREHCGGFSLQGKIPSYGVGSESCHFSDDLSYVFSPSGDRFVRVSSQLPAPEVLLSVPGCSGVENRRSVVSLDGSSTLRVSSLLSSPQDLGQVSPGRSRPSPGSSVLASEALVSSSPEALGGPSEDVASPERLGGTTHVFDSASQGRKSSSFSMASLRRQGEEAGLSQRAAQFAAEAFRQSTRDTYDSRLVPFREWCSKVPCDPTSAPLGVVADFLISRFDKGLTVVTLRSYRSAIASCHRGFSDGSSVTNSAFLTRLVKSFFLKRPPSKTLVPAWSLPAVLKVLASASFEPLHKASLRLLTLKMAFLVAIASGHRVSSLKALCIDPGHIRWEASGVRLIPKMGFIAKNQSLKSGSVEIFLPAISTLSSVEEDKVWCPVRALKWYVDRTKSKRASSSLFVATIAPHKEVATSTLAGWLVECIKMAGTEAILADRVRAHDTRSVSSSWALFNGASLKEIQQAAFWSNPNSFVSCYLKDVVVGEASFAAAVLKSSVSGSSGSGPTRRIP